MDEKQFQHEVSKFYDERIKFKEMLKMNDYKYFSFQLWQEDVARYTEYHIAKLAADKYDPTEEFKSLKDYIPFEDIAKSIFDDIISTLPNLSLKEYKRIAFYYMGAAEVLLLDR